MATSSEQVPPNRDRDHRFFFQLSPAEQAHFAERYVSVKNPFRPRVLYYDAAFRRYYYDLIVWSIVFLTSFYFVRHIFISVSIKSPETIGLVLGQANMLLAAAVFFRTLEFIRLVIQRLVPPPSFLETLEELRKKRDERKWDDV